MPSSIFVFPGSKCNTFGVKWVKLGAGEKNWLKVGVKVEKAGGKRKANREIEQLTSPKEKYEWNRNIEGVCSKLRRLIWSSTCGFGPEEGPTSLFVQFWGKCSPVAINSPQLPSSIALTHHFCLFRTGFLTFPISLNANFTPWPAWNTVMPW